MTLEIVAVVQLLSHVQFFVTPWTAACQASLSFTISQSLLKLKSIEWMMPFYPILSMRRICLHTVTGEWWGLNYNHGLPGLELGGTLLIYNFLKRRTEIKCAL